MDQESGMSEANGRLRRVLVWRMVALALVASLVLGAVYHRRLLAAAAGPLIVDQRDRAVSAVVLLGGDRRYEEAAAFIHRQAAGRVLLIEGAPHLLVEYGILEPEHELDRRALRERGAPESAIELLALPEDGRGRALRRLGQWLREHPGTQVGLLCDRFASRRLRQVVDAVLAPEEAARVAVWPLAHRDYDERSWWQGRLSARQFVYAWLYLVFQQVGGEEESGRRRWDPDAYEQELAAQARSRL